MTTPSVPRCGRLDEHEAHPLYVGKRIVFGQLVMEREYVCPGDVTTEMDEQRRLMAEVADERYRDYWGDE